MPVGHTGPLIPPPPCKYICISPLDVSCHGLPCRFKKLFRKASASRLLAISSKDSFLPIFPWGCVSPVRDWARVTYSKSPNLDLMSRHSCTGTTVYLLFLRGLLSSEMTVGQSGSLFRMSTMGIRGVQAGKQMAPKRQLDSGAGMWRNVHGCHI